MLEEKIRNMGIKMVAFAGVLGLYTACAPSLTVPTQIPGSSGYVATNRDCCAQLGCTSKGYDGCKWGDEEYNTQTGIYEQECSCYDRPQLASSSASSSSSSDRDRDPGYDRGTRSSGGHRVCKPRDN